MAGENRTTTIAIIDELLNNERPFSFFQAVKLLQQVTASSDKSSKPGHHSPFSQEFIQFRANASLGFPARDIEAIDKPDQSLTNAFPHYRMTVNFLGLYGPASPLPAYYTEDILFDDKDDSNVRHFLDMFHHRFISFIYRCWEKYRYYIQYEPGATDQFSQWMFALIGLGDKTLRQNSHIEWERLLPFVGLLGMKIRSAWVMQRVLSYYFGGCPVNIDQYVAEDIQIERGQRNSLGIENTALGVNLALGSSVQDCCGKFRVRLGPLSYEAYNSFLPSGKNYHALRELTKFVAGDPLEFDIDLIVETGDMPRLSLETDNVCRLGQTAWLGEPEGEDVTIRQAGCAVEV